MHQAAQACSTQKRVWEKEIIFLANFSADVIFPKGIQLKINTFFLLFFFMVKQHLVPGTDYFRKSPRGEVVRSSAGAGVILPPFLGSFT